MTDFKKVLNLSLFAMKSVLTLLLCGICLLATAQEKPGIIVGNPLDEKSKALDGTSVQLINLSDTNDQRSQLTDADGAFRFSDIAFGYYRLKFSYVGFQPL